MITDGVLIKDDTRCVLGDCLEVMKDIEDGSVDMILCDLPYGLSTTTCKWDKMIPVDKLWAEYKRIIKGNGAICLFGTEPFSSLLRTSNLEMFKYDWIWEKNNSVGFVNAKRKPMNKYEIISVFSRGICANTKYKERDMPYYPQGVKKVDKMVKKHYASESAKTKENTYFRPSHKDEYLKEYTNYPTNILKFKKTSKYVHPTEKPIALLEYLIKTYTKEGALVLDNCAGSFSTGVACMNTDRAFIGIEKEERYFKMGVERLLRHKKELSERLF